MLVRFGVAFLAVIVVHQITKFLLRLYQGWLTESAILYTRKHLLTLYGDSAPDAEKNSGRAISIVGAEVEKLGGFVGEALSQACANTAMLVGVFAYMFVVEPKIAVFAIAVLIPQILLTPFIQRHLNVLVERRVGLLRDLGDEISDMDAEKRDKCLDIIPHIFRNHMRFFLLKFGMKSLLNILNALGPVTVLIVGGYLVMIDGKKIEVSRRRRPAFMEQMRRLQEGL